jgi:hypothetical protein
MLEFIRGFAHQRFALCQDMVLRAIGKVPD